MRMLQQLIAIFACALPACAQDEICNTDFEIEQLVGNYTLQVGNAMMFAGGKFVPLGVQSTTPVSIYAVGDTLVMGDAPYTVLLSPVEDSEPNWRWGENASLATITSEDLALLVDCEVADLPRIVGQGTWHSPEGIEFTTTYRLVVWSLSDDGAQMFGALNGSGGGITQKRVVSLWPE